MSVDYHDKIIALINDGNIETAKMYVTKVMNDNYVSCARDTFKRFIRSEKLSKSKTYYDYIDGDCVLFGDAYSIYKLNSDEVLDEKYIKKIVNRKSDRPRVENRLNILNTALSSQLISVVSMNRDNIKKYFSSSGQLDLLLYNYKLYSYYLNMFLGEDIKYYLGSSGCYFIARSNKGETLVLGRKKSV